MWRLTSTGHKGTFQDDRSVLSHIFGVDTKLYAFVKTHHKAHLKWVQFIVSKLYLNKIDIKKYTQIVDHG